MEQGAPPPLPTPAADQAAAQPLPASSRLPLYMTLAYVVLIAYASLYPFANWRDLGVAPLEFLSSGWPRYWTGFDLAVNVLAYLPLGFLLTLTLGRLPGGRWSAAIVAALLGSLLSLGLECLQNWLPTRVPSNIDLACNAVGTVIGAIIAFCKGQQILARFGRVQQHLLAPAEHSELGLVLLGLWLLTQLSPETLLFATGDLRTVLELPSAVPYAAHYFFVLESGIIASNTIVIGILARSLLADRASPHLTLLAFFMLALTIRTLAASVLIAPHEALAWLTPGAELGLLVGGMLLSAILLLPPPIRIALAGVALMAGTALVNLTPANPYSEAALATWRQGHFLNFNGLTRWVASLWPFVALPYLSAVGRQL